MSRVHYFPTGARVTLTADARERMPEMAGIGVGVVTEDLGQGVVTVDWDNGEWVSWMRAADVEAVE